MRRVKQQLDWWCANMPIEASLHETEHGEVNIFHVFETLEVYDGSLALAIDHVINHIKVLVSTVYLPEDKKLLQAYQNHPLLRKGSSDVRSPERILLADCIRLLDGLVEIARLTAYPETSAQARLELEDLKTAVPFLDYRYENDPFPSDRDRE